MGLLYVVKYFWPRLIFGDLIVDFKKYLTTAYPNDLNYISLDLLGDLKKIYLP